MTPASSAAPGAWPIVGRDRQASCPPSAALTPQAPPGGVRAAEESGCGEYATFRVLWGLRREEKGAPRGPVHAARGKGRHRAGPKCRPRRARPSRRSLAAARGQPSPARWRVGNPAAIAPTGLLPRGRPASCRPHGPPAARRSAAAGPRRQRRTMPRSYGLFLAASHMSFFGRVTAFFPRKTPISPDFGVPSPAEHLVQ
jgi:hypothetical protein